MTQEQKAKAYDKAFEEAKNVHRFSSNIAEIKRMEEIFPELKESEDERVRKELLNYCKNRAEKYPNDPKYKNISAWIAWLEKQVSPILSNSSSIGKNFNYENANIQQKDFAPKPQRMVAAEAKEALYDKIVVSKDTIRLIIELFVSWNGETEAIDIANLSTAVEYINEYINEN